MQPQHQWKKGPEAWAEFVARHPELEYRPGKWQFYNFLRHYRKTLIARDAIRLARRRHWIAHGTRFNRACFALATGGNLAINAAVSSAAVLATNSRAQAAK